MSRSVLDVSPKVRYVRCHAMPKVYRALVAKTGTTSESAALSHGAAQINRATSLRSSTTKAMRSNSGSSTAQTRNGDGVLSTVRNAR